MTFRGDKHANVSPRFLPRARQRLNHPSRTFPRVSWHTDGDNKTHFLSVSYTVPLKAPTSESHTACHLRYSTSYSLQHARKSTRDFMTNTRRLPLFGKRSRSDCFAAQPCLDSSERSGSRKRQTALAAVATLRGGVSQVNKGCFSQITLVGFRCTHSLFSEWNLRMHYSYVHIGFFLLAVTVGCIQGMGVNWF